METLTDGNVNTCFAKTQDFLEAPLYAVSSRILLTQGCIAQAE